MKPEKLILNKLIDHLNKDLDQTKTTALEDSSQNIEYFKGYYAAIKATLIELKSITQEVSEMLKQQDKENFD